MTSSQKKLRCSKSFFIALFLVVIILGVYTIRYRSNAAISASEKQHSDWLARMKTDRGLQNDTVGYRHYERHEITPQSGISAQQDQARVSMVMPANIPEDLHKAQTLGVPPQYITENANSTHKLIEMKLKQSQTDRDYDDYDAQKQNKEGGDDHRHDNDDADRGVTSKEQYDGKTITTTPGLQSNVQNKSAAAPGFQSNVQNGTDTASGLQSNIQTAPVAETTLKSNTQTEPAIEPGMQPDVQTEPATAPGLQSNVQIEPAVAPGLQSVVQTEPAMAPGLQSSVQTQPAMAPGLQSNVKLEPAAAPGLQSNVQIEPAVAPGLQSNVQIEPAVAPGLQSVVQTEPVIAPGLQSSIQTGPVMAPGLQSNVKLEPAISPRLQSNVQNELQQKQEAVSNYTRSNVIQMELEPRSYVKPSAHEYSNPIVRSGYMGDSNAPSYNNGLNKYPVMGQQNIENNKGIGYGNVLPNTNVQFPNAYVQSETQGDKYRQPQLLNNGMNRVLQAEGSSTMRPLTLPGFIETRMALHKTLKDMRDIVNYGSPSTDEENKKPWNEGENRNRLYDVNDKDMFANLVMQVNSQAEPITGTKPMRPPYKSRIEYPDYLTPINWINSFENVKTPIFECVPMKTINSYIRICIHPPAVRSEVSSSLKSEASWEYNALRDVQRALLQHRDSVLIDIGASFGVFSLAAAALNRNVIAVEPFPSHIQVFKQSVSLNTFADHITLFQAVVSDRRGKVLIKPLGDHVNNVYIQTVEDDEQSTNYTLVVNTVTLDDIEKVCPSRVAVLKIDVPGFMKRALEYSHFFFKYIYVTHVFMHWDTNDRDLCLFILRFFVERGYQPYADLHGSKQLELKDAYIWTNDIVIWKL